MILNSREFNLSTLIKRNSSELNKKSNEKVRKIPPTFCFVEFSIYSSRDLFVVIDISFRINSLSEDIIEIKIFILS